MATGGLDNYSWNTALEYAAAKMEERAGGWPEAHTPLGGATRELQRVLHVSLAAECMAIAGQLREMKRKPYVQQQEPMGIAGVSSDMVNVTLFFTDPTGYSAIRQPAGSPVDALVFTMPKQDITRNIELLRRCADELLIMQARLPRRDADAP